MERRELEAISAICVMAALADGSKDGAERERIRAVLEGLSDGDEARALAGAQRRVLLKQTTLDDELRALTTPEHRMLAYEMAVAVCDADGAHDAKEGEFLERLRAGLSIAPAAADLALRQADELAEVRLDAAPPPPPPPIPAATAGPDVDGMILRYAILNGGLELLPQSLATMAIVPLQIKMVYRVGAAHGVTLDRGHIKEFIATVGVGMTSQVVENLARNLLRGFAKKLVGKQAGKLVGAATGAAMTFATTYALGQVAKQYYAGGRRLSAVDLRSLFSREVEQAKTLYERHRPAVEESARTTDVTKLLATVRGA